MKKRPFGIYVLIIFQLLFVIVGLITVLDLTSLKAIQELTLDDILLSSDVWILFIPVALIIILGLWRMRRWAWFFLMIQIGFNLLFSLQEHFAGNNPSYISMLLMVMMVFYLNQRDVRQAFQSDGEVIINAEAQSLKDELLR